MKTDTTVAMCGCTHDVGKHGITLLDEISGEYSMAGCFDKDCKCVKFSFKEGTFGVWHQ